MSDRFNKSGEVVSLRERAWAAAAAVVDPEIPVLTIEDLGVLREVVEGDAGVEVRITPTYTGCPAMGVIAWEVEAALELLWPYTGEMFEPEDEVLVAADVCPEPTGLREAWNRTVDAVLAEATLSRPAEGWMQSGGRAGRHTEHLGHMLAVMQSVARSHPGAKW